MSWEYEVFYNLDSVYAFVPVNGKVLCGSRGLYLYPERFIPFDDKVRDMKISGDSVWVLTRRRLLLYRDGEVMELMNFSPPLFESSPLSFGIYKNKAWVGFENGYWVMDGSFYPTDFPVFSILPGESLWIGGPDGVYKGVPGEIQKISGIDDTVFSLIRFNDTLFAGGKGIWRYENGWIKEADYRIKRFRIYENLFAVGDDGAYERNNGWKLVNEGGNDVLVKDGEIWVARNQGICAGNEEIFLPSPGSDTYRDMEEDPYGNIWFVHPWSEPGSRPSTFYYSLRLTEFTKKGEWRVYNRKREWNALARFYSIETDSHGLWIGLFHAWIGYAILFIPYDSMFPSLRFTLETDDQNTGQIFLFKDTLWVSTIVEYVVMKYSVAQDTPVLLDMFAGKDEFYNVRAIERDGDGNMWFGSSHPNGEVGITVIKKDGGRIKVSGLPSPCILSLAWDPRGWMWAATLSGLVKIEDFKVSGVYRDEPVYDVEVDPYGYVWFLSSSGLWRLTPSFEEEFFLSVETDIEKAGLLYDSRGRLWAGGCSGLYCIYPDESEKKREELTIYPNPWIAGRHSVVNITSPVGVQDARILIYSPSGEKLYEGFSARRIYSLDPSFLNSGIYIVVAIRDGKAVKG
ncbi:hypothetical protein DRQ18_00380, partial [bacterium]